MSAGGDDSANNDEVADYPTRWSAEGDVDLPPDKLAALTALLEGRSVTEAAEAADVHRATVHRWKSQDPDFRAALNEGRHWMQEQIRDRLLRAASHAADTVHEAVVEGGDVQTALKLLKGLGMLDGKRPAVGITEPWVYRMDQRLAERKRQEMLKGFQALVEDDAAAPLLMEILEEVLERQFEARGDEEISSMKLMKDLRERAIEAGVLEDDPGYGLDEEEDTSDRA